MGKRRGKASSERAYLRHRLYSAMLLAQADNRREELHDRMQQAEILERKHEDEKNWQALIVAENAKIRKQRHQLALAEAQRENERLDREDSERVRKYILDIRALYSSLPKCQASFINGEWLHKNDNNFTKIFRLSIIYLLIVNLISAPT